MKKITLSIALALILSLITRGVTGAIEVEATTDKLIRLHVIANSDSEDDQAEKLEVRDAVLAYVSDLTVDCETKSEAVTLITAHIEDITTIAKTITDQPVTVIYETVLVDKRDYDDFTLPEGYYDALCILIGEGAGQNWWCVLYPSLCVSGAISIEDTLDDSDLQIIQHPEKVQYKLFCYELWQKLKSLFAESRILVEAVKASPERGTLCLRQSRGTVAEGDGGGVQVRQSRTCRLGVSQVIDNPQIML